MSNYQLELKQIVDYPRCRIYRQFIQTLIADRSIRASGCSGLFYFVVLCSYANFRTSYRKIDGLSYTVYPGEWVCRLSELAGWFRTRHQYRVFEILDLLQEQHHIDYSTIGRGQVIKFKILGWRKQNTVLDYNAPCQKDVGFFFFPISKVTELISIGKCSQMDILLDLWMHAIYNDEQVQGSDAGPVAYFRNGTGSPLIGYAELARRWGMSKATTGRMLKKLVRQGYLSLLSFPGRHGSVIYLNNYLSTMFQISDVMIDKEEVAMSLNIKISVPDDAESEPETAITEEQFCVSVKDISVSKTHLRQIIGKVAQILSAGGLACCDCPKSKYKLYPLSPDCREGLRDYILTIVCGETELYRFDLRLYPVTKV
ncbi:MarR family transcriptional regulator [Caproicibacter sp. BJN0012]|uniref:MarR family transcriptional regulator n=1 Tax=Caproicibacter sp. BJN0012 TaxID=3110227 RepID=UPI002E0DFC6E